MSASKRTAPDLLNAARPEWMAAKRIVVKVGSSLLTDKRTGALKPDWLTSLMENKSCSSPLGPSHSGVTH